MKLMMVMNMLKDNRGIALPMALILMAVGGLFLVPATLSITDTAMKTDLSMEQNTQRLYAADAGINTALWKFQYDTGFTRPAAGSPAILPTITLNGSTIVVTITNDGANGYRISSAATRNGQTTTIVAYLNAGGGAYQSIFYYAAASLAGDITMGGSTYVTSQGTANQGDIYANGKITLTWGPYVDGTATSTGTPITDPGSGIHGTKTPSAAPLPAPDMSAMITGFKNATRAVTCPAVTGGNWSPGAGTYTNPRHVGGTMSTGYSTSSSPYVFNGPVCVDTDLKISSEHYVTFNGPVYVGRDIILSNSGTVIFNSTVYAGRNFTISGANSPTFNEDVYTVGAINFANGTITYGSNANLIADGAITISGAAEVQTGTEWPLISSSNSTISVTNGTILVGAVYAPNGKITVSGSSQITGAAIGKSIDLQGSGHIVYPSELRAYPKFGGGSGGSTGTTLSSYDIQ
jgi:hypothetical protein